MQPEARITSSSLYRTLVAVAEGLCRAVRQAAANLGGRVFAHLHRRGGDAWDALSLRLDARSLLLLVALVGARRFRAAIVDKVLLAKVNLSALQQRRSYKDDAAVSRFR